MGNAVGEVLNCFRPQCRGTLQELPAQSFSLLSEILLHGGSADHQVHFMPRYKQKELMYEGRDRLHKEHSFIKAGSGCTNQKLSTSYVKP